jgi:hypothetical protein
MKLLNQLKEFKALILIVTTIVAVTISSVSYFAKASVLAEHITTYEIDRLDDMIMKLELNYKCYRESCQEPMPPLLYEEYMKKIQKRERLEKGKKSG